MEMIIRTQKSASVKQCSCGSFPEFVQPNYNYTDIWLECKNCGRRTVNTGGYRYASEIPLEEAKTEAIKLWNSGNVIQ